jgi:hypothetical protein
MSKRDSKDPLPSAGYTARLGFGGNDPGTGGEKVGSGTAEKVSASQNRTTGSEANAVKQPMRDGGGNEPISQVIEQHGQRKAERVKASQRF